MVGWQTNGRKSELVAVAGVVATAAGFFLLLRCSSDGVLALVPVVVLVTNVNQAATASYITGSTALSVDGRMKPVIAALPAATAASLCFQPLLLLALMSRVEPSLLLLWRLM